MTPTQLVAALAPLLTLLQPILKPFEETELASLRAAAAGSPLELMLVNAVAAALGL